MSILIKGMEMPKFPCAIRIQIEADGNVYQHSDKTHNCWALQKNVTAIEVPKHGDLIDRDALNKEIDKAECYSYDPFVAHMSKCINDAPIIIEGET